MINYIYNHGMELTVNAWQGAVNLADQAIEAVHGRLPETPNWLRDNAISRFSRSVLGGMFVRAQAENVAECAGYYAPVYAITPAAPQIGRTLSRLFISQTAHLWSRVVSGGTLIQIFHNRLVNQRLNSTILSVAQIAALASAFLVSDAAIALGNPENVEAYLADHEETIGQITINYGIGLLAAFMAMKLTNTSEVFWDWENIPQSYFFKAIQSMVFCDLLEQSGALPSHPAGNAVATLICGSLAYNLVDIVDASTRTIQGSLLDGALPRRIPLQYQPLNEERIRHSVSSIANFAFKYRKELIEGKVKGIDASIPKHFIETRFWEALKQQNPERIHQIDLMKNVLKELSDLKKSKKTDKKIIQSIIDDLSKSYTLRLLENETIAARLAETNAIQNLNEVSSEKILTILARALNCYAFLLLQYPQFFEDLTRIWDEQFDEASPKARAREMFYQISQHREIREQLAHFLADDLIDVTLDAKLEIANLITPFESQREIREIARQILEHLSNFEETMVGTSVGSRERIALQRQNLERHLEKILALSPLFISSAVARPLGLAEMRQFYLNSSKMIQEHYSFTLNERVAAWIQKFLEKQIRHSAF